MHSYKRVERGGVDDVGETTSSHCRLYARKEMSVSSGSRTILTGRIFHVCLSMHPIHLLLLSTRVCVLPLFRRSKCLGPDFVPYLPLVMPPLLAAASANVRLWDTSAVVDAGSIALTEGSTILVRLWREHNWKPLLSKKRGFPMSDR